MLSDLEIRNFRTFKHLRIRRLGQVNLILGKNNVGKTTLLEALQIYGSPVPSHTAAEILDYRTEFSGTAQPEMLLDVKSVFHGREADATAQAAIGPGKADAPEPELHISARIDEDISFDPVRNNNRQERFPWGPQLVAGFGFRPPTQIVSTLLPSGSSWKAEGTAAATLVKAKPKPLLLRLTSPHSMAAETADRYDSIVRTLGEQEVIALLQVLAPIRDVRYIGSTEYGRTAIAQIEGVSERVPLMSLGDGVVHMFQIAVALQYSAMAWKANRGDRLPPNMFPLLLIDEIDSGIHYSIQPEVWRFVLQGAQKLGVQVFATTHSWDCVKGFAEAVQDVPECNALAIRLEKVEGQERTGAVTMDKDSLETIVNATIEVR